MVRFPNPSGLPDRVNAFCETRMSDIHGKGVFATRKIRKGTRIIEYGGDKSDKEESNRRGLALFDESRKTGGASVYIFDLNDDWDLDGNKPWNPARLINHSCEPNAEMVNEDDRLFLFATEDIAKGAEITFDYGYDMEHFMDHPCRCGKPSCIGYIVSASQRDKVRKILTRRKHRQKAGK